MDVATSPAPGGPLLLVLLAGVCAVADGAALLLAGTASLLPPGGAAHDLPYALLLAGVAASVSALGLLRPGLYEAASTHSPRLFPFASVGVQLAIFLVILLSAVAVFQGTFESFTSAHNGGDLGSAPDPVSADALVVAASSVLWLLTLYVVLGVRRVIRMGREIDAASGAAPFGVPEESDGEPPTPIAAGSLPADPRPVPRGFVFAMTLILAFAASVAVQVLEVGTLPAPAIDWLWAQLGLPVWAGLVAGAVSAADRGVRDLERRYARLGRPSDDGAPAPANPT